MFFLEQLTEKYGSLPYFLLKTRYFWFLMENYECHDTFAEEKSLPSWPPGSVVKK